MSHSSFVSTERLASNNLQCCLSLALVVQSDNCFLFMSGYYLLLTRFDISCLTVWFYQCHNFLSPNIHHHHLSSPHQKDFQKLIVKMSSSSTLLSCMNVDDHVFFTFCNLHPHISTHVLIIIHTTSKDSQESSLIVCLTHTFYNYAYKKKKILIIILKTHKMDLEFQYLFGKLKQHADMVQVMLYSFQAQQYLLVAYE